MNLPADKREFSEFAEAVAPGVARVRPAVFRTVKADPSETKSVPQVLEEGLASRRSTAKRAYAPTPRPAEARAKEPVSSPSKPGTVRAAPPAKANGDWEKQLAPLRGLSRELVGHGMQASLVTELLAEIVAEYGNQVLESEQDARWAIVEQLLLRISGDPLIPVVGPVVGTYIIAGPIGSGTDLLVGTMALAAAKRGQKDIVLVNTEAERIGAMAQMEALGKVFDSRVEHAYSIDEWRDIERGCNNKSLVLVQAAGWPVTEDADTLASAWSWQVNGAKKVLCVPATGQAEDLLGLIKGARTSVRAPIAVLSRTAETRNVVPAIGALASLKQAVGLVVRGPGLLQATAAPSLALIVRTALGIKNLQKKKGHVVC